ncbi:MAG: hypothetical protein ABJO01_11395 [Parasphingorhabdus sp.]|uniref:hypothetical protein n=1 Tax=Parasphingorhabdus sp. TaxID=2709688 RepID=UPI0032980299
MKILFGIAMAWIAVRVLWQYWAGFSGVMPAAAAERAPKLTVQPERPWAFQSHNADHTGLLHRSVAVRQNCANCTGVGLDEKDPFARFDMSLKSPSSVRTIGMADSSVHSPMDVAAYLSPSSLSADPASRGIDKPSALSGYFWLFARDDLSIPLGATAPLILPSAAGPYGGSQAGAKLSYRLAGHRSQSLSAYIGTSTALAAAGEEEVAFGLSAKPLANVPLSIFAEQRLGAQNFSNRGTAVFVAGGLEVDQLPVQIRLDSYGQVGFVLAKENGYFFDAAVTTEREIASRDKIKFSAGAGIWTGGQKGLHRIDIGPRAAIKFPIGQTKLNISVDWRHRIDGKALPDSGPALTISSSF